MMQPTFVVKNLCYSFNALPYHNLYRQMPYKLYVPYYTRIYYVMCFDIDCVHFIFVRQEELQIGEKWTSLSSDWNLDDGYGRNKNVPWRINSTGFWNSVEIILEQGDSFYGCSSKQGFTVERFSLNILLNSVAYFGFFRGTYEFIYPFQIFLN